MAKQDHENKWELGWCILEVHNGGSGSCQSWFQDLDCKVRSRVFVTSLQDHLHGIKQSWKRGKTRIQHKERRTHLLNMWKSCKQLGIWSPSCIIIIKGCKNYKRNVYTFQKKDSKVGVIEMVQEA